MVYSAFLFGPFRTVEHTPTCKGVWNAHAPVHHHLPTKFPTPVPHQQSYQLLWSTLTVMSLPFPVYMLYFCTKSARKRIVPPIERVLSFSTGTFLNNYDVIDRKLKPFVTYSTVQKWEKLKENTIVETTRTFYDYNPNW